jgi:hypothetical protein
MEREDVEHFYKLMLEIARNQLCIANRLDKVIEQNEQIMQTQQDLDTALQGEGTDLAAATAAFTALEQKLASIPPGSPAPDFTPEVEQIATFRSALQTMAASMGTDAGNLPGSSTGTTDPGTNTDTPAASANVARAKV